MLQKEENGKRFYIIIISILAALLVLSCVVIAVLLDNDTEPVSDGESNVTGNETTENNEVEKLTDSIAIPGFTQLTFKAGELEQGVALSNPEENFCYFKISLILEDGTLLWTSDLVEPGKQSEEITLLQSLDAGTYENVTVHYDCYTMDGDMAQLNSGEIKITLNVQ